MSLILLIRHAEKPTPDRVVRGVNEYGRADANELSVLGWQRAGALAAHFGHLDASAAGALKRPRHLFAARPTREAPSARSVSTLQPLADRMGLPIRLSYSVGQELQLARFAASLKGCVLIAWQHEGLHRLASHLVHPDASLPASWPIDRYDLIWILRGRFGQCSLEQRGQRLLAGDATYTG